jgi:hypothetical protein
MRDDGSHETEKGTFRQGAGKHFRLESISNLDINENRVPW